MKKHTYDVVIDHERPDYKEVLMREISYLHYEMDSKLKKDNTIKWIKSNSNYDYHNAEKLPDYEFEALGKYAFILNHDANLDEKTYSSFLKHIEVLSNKTPNVSVDEDAQPKAKISVEDRALDACKDVDILISKFIETGSKTFIDINKIKHIIDDKVRLNQLPFVIETYTSSKEEMVGILASKDEQIKEAYAHISNASMRLLIEFYEKLLETLQLKLDVSQEKKPKKKVVSNDQIVSKMKYKVCDGDIKSINPTLILGAKELWVLNTKTRKIGVYYSDVGFNIKGSTIENFTDKSVEKAILKVKEFDFKQFCSGVNAYRHNEFKKLKTTELKLSGKMVDTCLLLVVSR